ncbi:MAG TPA: tetratricopeptide repeat protein [Pyrinomonadaceae bacterium]|nr:tetratricopeptide repeat protein [Pyrinomonadaceae bacterium]
MRAQLLTSAANLSGRYNWPEIRHPDRRLAPALLALFFLFIHTVSVEGQAGGHTLFGDVKVSETNVDGVVPLSFDIALYTEGGTLLGRQTVTNNSRYRFLNVANGNYDVVVEVEASEVARIRVFVQSAFKTDFRQDIDLEWQAGVPHRQRTKPLTVSASDFYDRVGRNKSLFERAQRLLDNGRDREAASLLKQIVDIDPGDFQAWTELGTAHLMGSELAEAEKAYRRAIQERPTFALALLNLGRVLITQKRDAESIEPLYGATQARPDSADAHFLLGKTYLKLKQGSKAVPELNEALRLDPHGKAEAHLLLAALYNAVGLKDRAASEYEQFLAKLPDYVDRKKLERYISEHKKPLQPGANKSTTDTKKP